MGSASEQPEQFPAQSSTLHSDTAVKTTNEQDLANQLSMEKSSGGEQNDDNSLKPPRNVKGILWLLIVFSILSSTFLFSLDNTIVADVQPSIVRQFDSTGKLPWLSVAFLLGATGSTLFWGQCYCNFDAKYIYMLCVALFEVGSAICGAAPGMDALIVGRAICGIGGSGMYAGVMTLLSLTTSEHERPIYFGLTGLTWGAGTVLGPIIGGAFTDSNATWRWAFYINLCVGGCCAPIYIFLLPHADPQSTATLKDRIKKLDFLGTGLLCGVLAAGIMAISFGGTMFDWHSGRIIGLFTTAAALLILFSTQQAFTIGTADSQRLFPLQILGSPLMVTMFLATACASTVVFVPVYFIPLYFQFVRSDVALQAGVRLLPYVIFNVVTAMANGVAMSKKPYYMPWYCASGVLSVIGSALLYTVNATTSSERIYGYSIILGVGAGGFIQLSFTVAQAKAEKRMVPFVIGLCTFAQLAGPAVALSIANAVFLNEATIGIATLVPHLSRQDIQAAISGTGPHRVAGLSLELQQEVLNVIVKAMSKVYIISLSAGTLTLVMSVFMKRERLF